MTEGRRKWSELSEDEGNEVRHDPSRRVAAPAIMLVIVGCLGLVANCLLGVGLNALRQDRGPVVRPAGMDDETFKAYERGRATAPLLDCCLISLPTLAVYPLIIVAGVRMRQLRSRWLAITGAVLAMLPCSAVMLLGIPVGVWSLIVMADPTVREAFGAPRRRRERA
jgi:hypothetical protein